MASKATPLDLFGFYVADMRAEKSVATLAKNETCSFLGYWDGK
jgi:hypothetical protein